MLRANELTFQLTGRTAFIDNCIRCDALTCTHPGMTEPTAFFNAWVEFLDIRSRLTGKCNANDFGIFLPKYHNFWRESGVGIHSPAVQAESIGV